MQTFSQVERHFSEYLSLAEQLGRLTEQREALVELLELHRAYRYTDQARILDARLRRIDSLIESAQKDTLSVCFSMLFLVKVILILFDKDVGSIDSNIFSDFEDSVPAVSHLLLLFT